MPVASKAANNNGDYASNRDATNEWINTKPSMRESIGTIIDRTVADDIGSIIKPRNNNEFFSVISQEGDIASPSSNAPYFGVPNNSHEFSGQYVDGYSSGNNHGASNQHGDDFNNDNNHGFTDQRGDGFNNGNNHGFTDQHGDGIGKKAVSFLADLEKRAINSKLAYDNELSTRVAALAGRQGYYTGKYSYVAGKSIVQGTFGFSKHTANLIAEKSRGNITAKEAAISALSRCKKSISASGASIRKIIKKQTIEGVKNFRGSEDIGIQAIVKTSYIYLRTRRIVQSPRKNKAKVFRGTAKAASKVGQQTIRVSRSISAAAKRVFLNPIVVKGSITVIGLLFLVAIVMAAITAISSLIPSISLKSDAEELTKTYKYITELDSRFTEKINKVTMLPENSDVDEIHYYVNGVETYGDTMFIKTNADSILAYFDVKYDDYAFDKLIYGVFGGTNIKSELEALHDALYTITANKREEKIDGTDESKWHLDISIRMRDFDTYILEHASEMLTADQKERFQVFDDVGIYTAKKELGNPFGESNYFISTRFGWNIDTATGGLLEHDGIDIPKPEGTEIFNVMYGTVATVASDGERGNYVIVEHSDKQVIYQHMKDVYIAEGQILTHADVIGTVGTTGNSNFPHLHIEYKRKGFVLCPSIFIDGVATISGVQPGFPGIGGAGGGDILELAASQIGNVGGQPYWSHYGFKHRTAWCAIFVSWCAEMTGNLNTTVPKFFLCTNGVDWFLKRGLFQHRASGYVPQSGDIIFFDFSSRNGSGARAYGYGADHVGYVESCDGAMVYTIEGNTSNSVARRRYNIHKASIIGYGTPVYNNFKGE